LKLTLKKSQLYLILGFFTLGIIGTFVTIYFLGRNGGNEQNESEYSYILDDCKIDTSLTYYHDALTLAWDADPWQQRAIQPIVKDYVTEDGKDYLLGVVPDQSNNCVVLKVLVSGDISTGTYQEDWDFTKINRFGENLEKIDFDELEFNAPIDSQIRIEYLSTASVDISDENCNLRPPSSQFYCTIQEVYEQELNVEIEYLNPSNISNGREIYGVSLTDQVVFDSFLPTDTGNE
jgi:hypothetical protein